MPELKSDSRLTGRFASLFGRAARDLELDEESGDEDLVPHDQAFHSPVVGRHIVYKLMKQRIVLKTAVLAILMFVTFGLGVTMANNNRYAITDMDSSAVSDTLRVWQSAWAMSGFKYEYRGYENGVGFAGRNIKRILSADPEALAEANTFSKYQVPTFFTTLISAAALGWGLGRKDEKYIYIGAGGIVVSFVFDQIGYSHLKKAVSIFNRNRANQQ